MAELSPTLSDWFWRSAKASLNSSLKVGAHRHIYVKPIAVPTMEPVAAKMPTYPAVKIAWHIQKQAITKGCMPGRIDSAHPCATVQ